MLDKLLAAKKKLTEITSRLDQVMVTGEAEGGLIKVTATANKEVTEVSIDQALFADADKERLEELLPVAINNALKQADSVSQAEMENAAHDMLGGLDGAL